MLDFSNQALVQIFWTLCNFGLVASFFIFYFYPAIKKQLEKRFQKELMRKQKLDNLSEKIYFLAKNLDEYKKKIFQYKKEKIEALEKEIAEQELHHRHLLATKYETLRIQNNKEIELFMNEKKMEEHMLKYTQLICSNLSDKPINEHELVDIYNKMKVDIKILKRKT